jgi:hypothetical protein
MTERIPTPLAAKQLVYTGEELRRKHEGTWDATTMVSVTSPEGAALLASQRASPEKVADAQPIAIEPLKNETLPSLSTRDEIIMDGLRLINGALFCYGVNNDVPGPAQNRIGPFGVLSVNRETSDRKNRKKPKKSENLSVNSQGSKLLELEDSNPPIRRGDT